MKMQIMKKAALAGAVLCLMSAAALAQTPTQLYYGAQAPSATGPKTFMQPVDTTHPLPVTNSGSGGSVTQGTSPWVTSLQGGATTVTTASQTAGTFAQMLAANTARKSCTIQGFSSTGAVIYYEPSTAASPTTSNTFQVSSGGYFYCASQNSVVTDQIRATCGAGTCTFVISEQ